MKDSNFVFNYVHILIYVYHKISFSCRWSNIDISDWIKKKKATTNPIKNMMINASNTLQQLHEIRNKLETIYK